MWGAGILSGRLGSISVDLWAGFFFCFDRFFWLRIFLGGVSAVCCLLWGGEGQWELGDELCSEGNSVCGFWCYTKWRSTASEARNRIILEVPANIFCCEKPERRCHFRLGSSACGETKKTWKGAPLHLDARKDLPQWICDGWAVEYLMYESRERELKDTKLGEEEQEVLRDQKWSCCKAQIIVFQKLVVKERRQRRTEKQGFSNCAHGLRLLLAPIDPSSLRFYWLFDFRFCSTSGSLCTLPLGLPRLLVWPEFLWLVSTLKKGQTATEFPTTATSKHGIHD